MRYVFILLAIRLVSAQYQNVKINAYSQNPEEVTIAINPANPANLVAGANIDNYYYSFDGGSTWQEGRLESTYGVAGDPCVIFDAQGTVYYSHLSNPADGYWLDRMVVQKSSDGGKSWDNGVGVAYNHPKNQDKEWLACDLSSGALYMCWTEFDAYDSKDPKDKTRILFSRSPDGSQNWSAPVVVSDREGNCIDSDSTAEGAVPAVGPDGQIYVSWSLAEKIWFDRSLDGGQTFGNDIFVSAQPGGWDFSVPGIYRCSGMPVTLCDTSQSEFRGNIYIVWSDKRDTDADVFLIKSVDGGDTWGETVKVNDDTTHTDQFFPWAAIDPATGYIYVVFYDRRNYEGKETDVFLARSIDGGVSFENFKISESSFVPDSTIFFGDYINIAARNGKIYPIWMRMDDWELSIWAALIDETTSIDNGQPLPIESFVLCNNYPNPFNPRTTIRYYLPQNDYVRLDVTDNLGRKIKTLFEGRQYAGEHQVVFDGNNLPSGVYYGLLQVGGRATRTVKMVLLK